jgi:hypothetical protein
MASSTANISGDAEAPVTPAPAPEAKVEAPKAAAKPVVEAPKVEAPKAEAPKDEVVAEAPVPLEFLSGEALVRAQAGVRVG